MGRKLLVVERAELVWNSSMSEAELTVWVKSSVDGFFANIAGSVLWFSNTHCERIVNGDLVVGFKAVSSKALMDCSEQHQRLSQPVCLVGS